MKTFFLVLTLLSTNAFASAEKWKDTLPLKSRFEKTQELKKAVDFWVKIYSHYTTKQGVLHYVDNPGKILAEIDLTDIYNNSVFSDKQKDILVDLEITKQKVAVLKKYKIKNPTDIRLQMGLKDRMLNALYNSGKYLSHMEKIFHAENLPIELTRLVFVESSFNVYAQSKVGASGLWQIMPNVAKPHGYIQKNYDYRNHPIYATKLAAQILKTNHKGLKSWPLAITAYNHGLTGVRRMIKNAGSDKIDRLIASDNPTGSWGFASKNFYACFLAVLEVERNATKLFGAELLRAEPLRFKDYKLKSNVEKEQLVKLYGGSRTKLKMMNPHVNWSAISKTKVVPAGIELMLPVSKSAALEKQKEKKLN